MKILLVVFLSFALVACGLSESEKLDQARVACSVIEETPVTDSVKRIEKINQTRDKIGGAAFVDGDSKILEAIEYDLCKELVLDLQYEEKLAVLQEEERLYVERAIAELELRNSKPTYREEQILDSGQLVLVKSNYAPKNEGGKKHGLEQVFTSDGQHLLEEGNYVNGLEIGIWEGWSPNGDRTYKSEMVKHPELEVSFAIRSIGWDVEDPQNIPWRQERYETGELKISEDPFDGMYCWGVDGTEVGNSKEKCESAGFVLSDFE